MNTAQAHLPSCSSYIATVFVADKALRAALLSMGDFVSCTLQHSFDMDAHAPFDATGTHEDLRTIDKPISEDKIISRKAMSDYTLAETRFLDFLAKADVWSQDEVRSAPRRYLTRSYAHVVPQACMCLFGCSWSAQRGLHDQACMLVMIQVHRNSCTQPACAQPP